jgi:hypothetical protein
MIHAAAIIVLIVILAIPWALLVWASRPPSADATDNDSDELEYDEDTPPWSRH